MTQTSMEKPVSQQGTTAKSKPLTTFVQADSNSFRDVVQRLTGPPSAVVVKAAAAAKKPQQQCKLHERRQCSKPELVIEKPCFPFGTPTAATTTFALQPLIHIPSNGGSGGWQIFSPSMALSSSYLYPPSPLTTTTTDRDLNNNNEEEEEEEARAIKARRFYLHQSPRSKPGQKMFNEPELLTLFPLTSPKTNTEPSNLQC